MSGESPDLVLMKGTVRILSPRSAVPEKMCDDNRDKGTSLSRKGPRHPYLARLTSVDWLTLKKR